MAKQTTQKVATKAAAPKAAKPAAAAPAAPATKKAAAKPAAAKKTLTPVPVAAPVPVPAPAKPKAPAKKPVAKKPVAKAVGAAATVLVTCDAGFGNSLAVRGSGPGLSWDHGITMTNLSADLWSWTSGPLTAAVEVKVLLNDAVWSSGENIVLQPGATVTVEPLF
jgi:hypothetical protein